LRRNRRDEVDGIIGDITRTRTVAEWQERLTRADVPHAPVLGINAALAHPQALAREMVVTADHATIGEIKVIGRPVKFPGAPQPPVTAPPTIGQHTEAVLRDQLGYSAGEIDTLRRDGIIDRVTRRPGS
jgi:formyl-CoA transferase/CoA:oxalate CoA-transferase